MTEEERIKQLVASAFNRRDDVVDLVVSGGVGIELGVAEGFFAERVLSRSRLSFLYGVDMYAGDRGHNVEQYKRALSRLAPFRGRHALMKLRFDEAVDLFPDAAFDFIYVDGYAHDGEDGGRTFQDWWPKLKPGGVFSGDDYHKDWPLVVQNVDRFIAENGLDLHTIACREEGHYSRYPTWFVIKPPAETATVTTRELLKARLTEFMCARAAQSA